MQHFVNEDSACAPGACERSLTADACLPHPLTPFKQIIIFRDVPPSANDRFPCAFVSRSRSKDDRSGIIRMCSCSYIRSRSVMGKSMIYIWHDKNYSWASNRHSSARRRRSCCGRTADDVRGSWQIAVFDFIGVWPWKLMWDPFILWEGIDYEPMCFQ